MQLTFYGAYHNNPINITIHEIFVPILLWYVNRVLVKHAHTSLLGV